MVEWLNHHCTRGQKSWLHRTLIRIMCFLKHLYFTVPTSLPNYNCSTAKFILAQREGSLAFDIRMRALPGTREQACSCLMMWLSSPWRLAPLEFLRASNMHSASTVPSPSASNWAKAYKKEMQENKVCSKFWKNIFFTIFKTNNLMLLLEDSIYIIQITNKFRMVTPCGLWNVCIRALLHIYTMLSFHLPFQRVHSLLNFQRRVHSSEFSTKKIILKNNFQRK